MIFQNLYIFLSEFCKNLTHSQFHMETIHLHFQLETIHLQFAEQHETEKEQIAQIETYQKENEELAAQIQSLEDHRLHYEQETDVKMKEFQMQIKHSSLHNMEEENKWIKLKEQTEKNNSILENKLKQQLEKNNAIMAEGVKWSKEVRR